MPNWVFILLVCAVIVVAAFLLFRLTGGWLIIALLIALAIIFGLTIGFGITVGHHHAGVSVGAGPASTAPASTTPTATTAAPAPSTTTPMTTSATNGGNLSGGTPVTNADQECEAMQPGPSGLVAAAHFAAGPLIPGGSIPMSIKVCRVAPSMKEAANFFVAFGVGVDGRSATDYAKLTFEGGGAYRIFRGNWFFLPPLKVGQAWTLPATLNVPPQHGGSAALCLWATFAGMGGLPSHDASGNAVFDWQDPQASSATCKAFA